MALYVVVHHQQDKSQPWVNAWLNHDLIEAIQTTKEIGTMCRRAKEHGERVFVHRCSLQENPPVICCSAMVEDVAEIDRSTALVRFVGPTLMNQNPPQTPIKGQNFYIC